ncbi:hypothetical protein Poli38472_008920 [Pythium oligandrum]|uniref:Uncharacterized protein n=1 Tax=Pythium oligandrum TaxID=41045 RepID=A0A8K1C4D1_PYTOL|nr:hypothetical protein Poli38472_008920 [Pythium oligandrum]|eukprot:TMW56272.1 hypothetical protein Poli38472_008920 [Pythium oligandrum]
MASTANDRFRKKPRLSPSAASTASHRVKNGVAGASSARPQYAFGSRLPLAGKENVNSNTLKTTVVSHSSGVLLKKSEKDSQMPASAMKNRLKRPRSATNASNEAVSTRTAMPSGIPAPQINVQASLASSKATAAVKAPQSEPEVDSVTTENEPEAEDTTESVEEEKKKKEEESDTAKETEELEEAVESLFDTLDASRAGFWKQRQAFVLTAMKDMQSLQ